MKTECLLDVRSACRRYKNRTRSVAALNDVSLTLERGEILGVVGRSGCGKSTLLRHIACLEKLTSGQIRLDGRDVTSARPADVCRRVQMIFQNAVASFDPRMTLRDSLLETFRLLGEGAGARERLGALLREVGLGEETVACYPHQVSGGQCQRAAIVRALAADPPLLLCDEITSALDVSSQAQIVRLIARLRRRRNCAVLFVSHDLALVACLCDRIVVMQDGRIAEEGTPRQIAQSPRAECTKKLLASVLTLDALERRNDKN